jgi:OmpR family response regulator RpaB
MAMSQEQESRFRLLVVDLDEAIRQALPERLINQGHTVLMADNFGDALRLLQLTSPHLIILDGQPWPRQLMVIRQQTNIPLILLKSNDDVAERVTALQLGADDVLTKPFSVRELEARIRAVLRRITRHPEAAANQNRRLGPQILLLGDLRLDLERRLAFRGQQRIRLTELEFRLLEVLINHAGETLSRTEIVQTVWGLDSELLSTRRLVDSSVSRLRAKLEVDPDDPELILTTRGMGYMFRRLHNESGDKPQGRPEGITDLDTWRKRQWGLPPS